MRQPLWLLLVFLAALATTRCASHEDGEHHDRSSATAHHDGDDGDDGEDMDDEDDGEEQEIALSAVPPNVLAAAQAALPGARFTEAETEMENGALVYTLEGVLDGVEWEVEVSADGKVLETEKDED